MLIVNGLLCYGNVSCGERGEVRYRIPQSSGVRLHSLGELVSLIWKYNWKHNLREVMLRTRRSPKTKMGGTVAPNIVYLRRFGADALGGRRATVARSRPYEVGDGC